MVLLVAAKALISPTGGEEPWALVCRCPGPPRVSVRQAPNTASRPSHSTPAPGPVPGDAPPRFGAWRDEAPLPAFPVFARGDGETALKIRTSVDCGAVAAWLVGAAAAATPSAGRGSRNRRAWRLRPSFVRGSAWRRKQAAVSRERRMGLEPATSSTHDATPSGMVQSIVGCRVTTV